MGEIFLTRFGYSPDERAAAGTARQPRSVFGGAAEGLKTLASTFYFTGERTRFANAWASSSKSAKRKIRAKFN